MTLLVFSFAAFSIQIGTIQFPTSNLFAIAIQDEDESEKQEDDEPQSESEKLKADQNELFKKYKLLEEKLFTLHEFEKNNNPTRSKLLERAYIQSQEKLTTSQMRLIVNLLTKAKLKDAQSEQDEVLSNLNQLLELLQSEDRGKRVRDAIQRNQEYLKEVERILRIQKGIRGQTEGGVNAKRLANSQQKLAKRTKQLQEEMRQEEDGSEEEQQSDSSGDPTQDNSNKPSSPDADAEPNSDKTKNKGKGQSSEKDPKGEAKGDSSKSDNDPPKDGSPETEENGSPSDGDQSGNNPSQNGKQGSDSSQSQSGNPARQRIQSAEERMRSAQENLEQAQRDDSIEEMKKAEREMALAKKELEEILRQLRKEEVERTLAMLEGRFRKMLEREVRVQESTRKLGQVVPEQRGTEFEIRAGKLAVEQNSIATEAGRALMILLEDGSSVAFPATVEEMHQDMLQVSSRLSAAKVGTVTIEIEADIVDTLDYLIKALVKTQQDMESMQQKNSQQGGQAGDRPLVDQLAEIKMLRGLQERILRRHRRYSKFLDDPEDLIGSTDDPELQSALQRLAERQAQLTKIARDIVNEKNK